MAHRLISLSLGLAAPVTASLVAVFFSSGGCVEKMAEGGRPVSVTATRVENGNAPPALIGVPLSDKVLARTHGSMLGKILEAPETPLSELLEEADRPIAKNGLCPADMASIDDRFCVDRYEASLVEMLADGQEVSFSPYLPVDGRLVRAVSKAHVFPQGYISGNQAKVACARSGKRLCRPDEWVQACMGPEKRVYGYGNTAKHEQCNDHGRSGMSILFGPGDRHDRQKWSWDHMNTSTLNQLTGTLARSGEHPQCTNEYGVFDMVGNLHEWVDDPKGTFQGGYYLDTHQNGDGCHYRTTAHEAWYHDYSTGFRCCADIAQ